MPQPRVPWNRAAPLLSLAHLPLLAHSQAHSDSPAATVVRRLGQPGCESRYPGRCCSTREAFGDTSYLDQSCPELSFCSFFSGQDKVTAVMLMARGKAVITSQSEAWVWRPLSPGSAFVALAIKLVLPFLVMKPFPPPFRE